MPNTPKPSPAPCGTNTSFNNPRQPIDSHGDYHRRKLACAAHGDSILAVYRFAGEALPAEAKARAEALCVEQTVEFPLDLIHREDILQDIVGKIRSLQAMGGPDGNQGFEAEIAFPVAVAGRELTQLLNVLFGNISLEPGVRLARLTLPAALLENYRGPRFGRQGLRELLGAPHRPLTCAALKPMGLDGRALAELARRFALGGIDMIKDDHGLADQVFCPFEDRVARCAEAVREANARTGRNCLYFPNVTASAWAIRDRARFARDAGAGGILISPGLCGFDAMRALADDEGIALPILSHPAFLGAWTLHPASGIAHGVLYGQINRLAGADACIFPSYGGRFSFTEAECRDIAQAAARPMEGIRPLFPAPAGGMRLDRVPELVRFYGNDCILLVGGDLHRHGGDLVENGRRFVRIVKKVAREETKTRGPERE